MEDPFSSTGVPNDRFVQLVEGQRAQLGSISDNWPNSCCLLADIGEYLVRCAETLSQLAEGLAEGQHVQNYAKETIEGMKRDTDFSDLEQLDYFDSKHLALRGLADQLRSMATDLDIRWQESVKPPNACKYHEANPQAPMSVQNHGAVFNNELAENRFTDFSTRHGVLDSPPTGSLPERSHVSETDGTLWPEDPIHDTIRELLSSVSARGKGNHTCPFGSRCEKGGVGSDGTLVIFERNSAFRSHLDKHGKLFKCDLPGCKNYNGFARKDQLRRHQETVAHNT